MEVAKSRRTVGWRWNMCDKDAKQKEKRDLSAGQRVKQEENGNSVYIGK